MRRHGHAAARRRLLVGKTIVLSMFCARVKAAHKSGTPFVKTPAGDVVDMRELVGAVKEIYLR